MLAPTRDAQAVVGPNSSPQLRGRRLSIVVCECGKRGFGFPGHIGVDLAVAVFQDLDDAVTSQVQIFTRVAAMRQVIACERVDEGVVNALRREDVEKLVK